MREIGIGELEDRLCDVLEQVQRGGSVRVMEHGRAVAEFIPPRAGAHEDRARMSDREG